MPIKPWPVRARHDIAEEPEAKPNREEIREASHALANSATSAAISIRRIRRDVPGYLIEDMLLRLRGEK